MSENSERITLVGTFRLPEERFEEWDEAITDMVTFVKAHVPRLISFDVYVDGDRQEGSVVYVHPDAASFEEHMRVAAQRIDRGNEMVDVVRVEVFGDPGQRVRDRLEELSARHGYPVFVKYHFLS